MRVKCSTYVSLPLALLVSPVFFALACCASAKKSPKPVEASTPSAGSTAPAPPSSSTAPSTPAVASSAPAATGAVASAGAAPSDASSPPTRIVSNDGSYIVLFTTRPDPIPTNDLFEVRAKIYDARRGQQLVTDADVQVDAGMPEHRHGMNVVPRVRKLNDGAYLATGLMFHMPGRWEIYFDITRKGETERAQAEVMLE